MKQKKQTKHLSESKVPQTKQPHKERIKRPSSSFKRKHPSKPPTQTQPQIQTQTWQPPQSQALTTPSLCLTLKVMMFLLLEVQLKSKSLLLWLKVLCFLCLNHLHCKWCSQLLFPKCLLLSKERGPTSPRLLHINKLKRTKMLRMKKHLTTAKS